MKYNNRVYDTRLGPLPEVRIPWRSIFQEKNCRLPSCTAKEIFVPIPEAWMFREFIVQAKRYSRGFIFPPFSPLLSDNPPLVGMVVDIKHV